MPYKDQTLQNRSPNARKRGAWCSKDHQGGVATLYQEHRSKSVARQGSTDYVTERRHSPSGGLNTTSHPLKKNKKGKQIPW